MLLNASFTLPESLLSLRQAQGRLRLPPSRGKENLDSGFRRNDGNAGVSMREDTGGVFRFGGIRYFLWWNRMVACVGEGMGPRIREETGGGDRRRAPWSFFAICGHLFHRGKGNRGWGWWTSGSCHNGAIGSTPIPSTSSGQALTFPHQGGRDKKEGWVSIFGDLCIAAECVIYPTRITPIPSTSSGQVVQPGTLVTPKPGTWVTVWRGWWLWVGRTWYIGSGRVEGRAAAALRRRGKSGLHRAGCWVTPRVCHPAGWLTRKVTQKHTVPRCGIRLKS